MRRRSGAPGKGRFKSLEGNVRNLRRICAEGGSGSTIEKRQGREQVRNGRLLTAAIAEGNQGGRRWDGNRRNQNVGGIDGNFCPALEKNQCALGKRKGHWKRECPQNRFRKRFP